MWDVEGYRERLRTVMTVRGLSGFGDLAKAWGLTEERVAHLYERPQCMLADELVAFRMKLGVRGGWLRTGRGGMLPVTATKHATSVLAVADSMPESRRDIWIAMGRWIATAKRNRLPW